MTDISGTNAEPTQNLHPEVVAHRGLSWASVGILFSGLACVILIIGFYLGFNRLLGVNAQVANIATNVSHQATQNKDEIATLQKTIGDTQQNLQQWHDELIRQQQSLNELRNATQGNKQQWLVSEAQYLTKLANDNLQVGDNVALVITMLQTADGELKDLNDPNVLSIRKALASDIAALQAVPQVDTTGIYLQLSALNDQVDKLPLPNFHPVQTETEAAKPDTTKPWWKRGLQQSMEALRQIVIIRYHQPGDKAFIAPDEQAFVYQNIHAMLEQSMTAVVHKQPAIYRESLRQALTWIKQYYLADSAVTKSIVENLTQLQTQNIKPDLPNLSASLQAFRDYTTQQQQQPASSSTTTTPVNK